MFIWNQIFIEHRQLSSKENYIDYFTDIYNMADMGYLILNILLLSSDFFNWPLCE